MPTNIDTAVATATALDANTSSHVFVMSNGDIAVFYKLDTTTNGWGYRVKHAGTWGAFTALGDPSAATTHINAVFMTTARNGDTIYLCGGPSNSNAAWREVYNTGTQTFTETRFDVAGSTGNTSPSIACYFDTTNNYLHVVEGLSAVGGYITAINSAFNALAIASVAITGQQAYATFGLLEAQTNGLVGDGSSTFNWYWYWDGQGTFTTPQFTQIVAGAAAYTQTADTTGPPAPAGNVACQGVKARHDGTNIVFVFNENNAKLRTSRRTAANTYDANSDLDANAVGGAPTITRKGTGANSDLGVSYKRTSAQANGEIYELTRIGGTWGAATLQAGGAATGWSAPSTDPSDLNDTSGIARLVYLTGTANPWTLVEDSFTIGVSIVVSVSSRVLSGLAFQQSKILQFQATPRSSVIVGASSIFNIVTASDVIGTLSEIATRLVSNVNRTATDTISTFSEIATRFVSNVNRAASDTIATLTEVATRTVNLLRTASDVLVGYSETATRSIQAFTRTATDSLGALSEAVTRLVSNINRTATDTIAGLSESATLLRVIIRSAVDTVSSWTDVATRSAQTFTRTVSDTISTFSEVATRSIQAFTRTATDVITTFSESAAMLKVIIRSAVDTMSSWSDVATRAAQSFSRSSIDTISTFSEVATRVSQVFVRSISESLSGISEVAIRLVSSSRTAADIVSGFIEIATRLATFSRIASESLSGFSESASRSAQVFLRTASDTVSLLVDIATGIGGAAATVFVSFVVYGRSGILKMIGRTGIMQLFGRSGGSKNIGR